MKAIAIELTVAEKDELLRLRKKNNSYLSERALAILHSNDGCHSSRIARTLKRAEQTIRTWLNAYRNNGIDGLKKDFSPGRPSPRKQEFIPRVPQYLENSPRDFGWAEDIWSIKVLIAQFEKETGIKISYHTVYRALKDAGYSCKRAKKTPLLHAPSKEDKIKAVNAIIQKIGKLGDRDDVEVYFLDERHFSTEPYVVRGWSKRGEPFPPLLTPRKRDLCAIFGAFALKAGGFYSKSSKKSNFAEFKKNLHQLQGDFPNKTIRIILDNASILACKVVKKLAADNEWLCLHYLPTYSPEYNPVEQV